MGILIYCNVVSKGKIKRLVTYKKSNIYYQGTYKSRRDLSRSRRKIVEGRRKNRKKTRRIE
jgi:hypothetical protein